MNWLLTHTTGGRPGLRFTATGLIVVVVVIGISLGAGNLGFAQAPELDPAAAPVVPEAAGMPTNLIEILRALHYWAIPFVIATLLLVWFSVERMVVLRRGRVIPKPFVQRFIRLVEDGEMEQDEALEACQESDSPIANIFAHAVRKWGKPSVEVEQAVIDGGERQIIHLRRNLRVLNGLHTIMPMIGLLGTVWGMLESFSQIANAGAMGNTEQLAGGIALALVTTAAGLLTAIPALVVYLYFSGRIETLITEMDDLSQRVVHAISAEGLLARAGRPKKAAPKPELDLVKKR